jgi:large subunit ribosomal protein L29
VKVDELRVLEADELGVRLRTARRELYELRFKHAVGQVADWSQIKKVRHDMARILTVLRERDLGIGPTIEQALQEQAAAVAPQPEPEVKAEEPKPKRGRRAKKVEVEEEQPAEEETEQ